VNEYEQLTILDYQPPCIVPPPLKMGCWLTMKNFGGNRFCATDECTQKEDESCFECDRYIQFYAEQE
jgi:hypothetical protein